MLHNEAPYLPVTVVEILSSFHPPNHGDVAEKSSKRTPALERRPTEPPPVIELSVKLRTTEPFRRSLRLVPFTWKPNCPLKLEKVWAPSWVQLPLTFL